MMGHAVPRQRPVSQPRQERRLFFLGGRRLCVQGVLLSWWLLWMTVQGILFLMHHNEREESKHLWKEYPKGAPSSSPLGLFLDPSTSDRRATTAILHSRVLSVVPTEHQLPPEAASNFTRYLQHLPQMQKQQQQESSSLDPLWVDYNPSLLALPNKQPQKSFRSQPCYLVSFRVSDQSYCFAPEDRRQLQQWRGGGQSSSSATNLLGLALVSCDFQQVHESALYAIAPTVFRTADDVRLFDLSNANDSRNSQGLVVGYIGTYNALAPLYLPLLYPHDREESSKSSPMGVHRLEPRFHTVHQQERYRGVLHMVEIGPAQCVPCPQDNQRASCMGKNWNYFVDVAGQVRVEIWPSQPHTVRSMMLSNGSDSLTASSSCSRHRRRGGRPHQDNDISETFVTTTTNTTTSRSQQQLSSILPPMTRGRGGFCCVRLVVGSGQPHGPAWRNFVSQHLLQPEVSSSVPPHVLLGVRHTKTPPQKRSNSIPNHYLSSFYLVDPQPPYPILSESEPFCLGFADNDDFRNNNHPAVVPLTHWRTLQLVLNTTTTTTTNNNNNRLTPVRACPRIHFVTGLAWALDALPNWQDELWVSYGVNDCYSRFVRLSLEHDILPRFFPAG